MVRQLDGDRLLEEGTDLPFQLTTFQTDQSVGKGITLLLPDVLAHDLHQVAEWHDRTAHDKIKQLLLLFRTGMKKRDIAQPNGFRYGLSHLDLLADTIDQVEMAISV